MRPAEPDRAAARAICRKGQNSIAKSYRISPLPAGHKINFLARLFFFLGFFSFFSCAPQPSLIQAKRAGAFKRPSCGESGPTAEELERQKEDLFDLVKSSDSYTSLAARDSALQKYRALIEGMEQSACPADLELFIENIAELHSA